MEQRILLDSSAGAPVWPEVKAAVLQALELSGNPSSIHAAGRQARALLEDARAQVAALLNAQADTVHFTACGTESNVWALRGLIAANKRPHPHVVISVIEHPSILLTARRLEMEGVSVSVLPVDGQGLVSPTALEAALTDNTALVSIMAANGEIGTIQPVKELAAIAHARGALFHTDAVAAVGFMPVDVEDWKVDALSLAANTWHGPAGAAALYVREGVRVLPLLEGGGQEQGGRSGTEALPAIAGMGAAALRAKTELSRGTDRLAALRDRLREGLTQRLSGLRTNGSWACRLAHNLHVCVDGASSESLVLALDQAGVATGLGSACNAKAMRPSHVLKAIGLSDAQAAGALVLSLSWMTSVEAIDRAVELIADVTGKLRRVTALTARS